MHRRERGGAALAEFTARAARRSAWPSPSSPWTTCARPQRAERWVRQLAEIFESHAVETRTVVERGKVGGHRRDGGEDHVIVIGRSNESELKKFFLGSRPIRVIQEARCPVLYVI